MKKQTRLDLIVGAAAVIATGTLVYQLYHARKEPLTAPTEHAELQQATQPAVVSSPVRQERIISTFTCKETLEHKCIIPYDAGPAPQTVEIIEPLIQKFDLWGSQGNQSFLQMRGDTDTGNKIAYLNEDGTQITTLFVAKLDHHLKDKTVEVSRCEIKLDKQLAEICWGYATPIRYGPCWVYGIEQGSKKIIGIEVDRLDAYTEDTTYKKHIFAEAKDALIEDLAFGTDYDGTLSGRLYFTVHGKEGTVVQTMLWDGKDLRTAHEDEVTEYRRLMLPNKPRGNNWSENDAGMKHNNPEKTEHRYNKVWTQPDGVYIGTGFEDIKHRIDFSMPGDKCPVWYRPR